MEVPANRLPGAETLVHYGAFDPGVWHSRIILEWVGGELPEVDVSVVLTPDLDLYMEDMGTRQTDIADSRDRPVDRSVPFGVVPGEVYDFAVLPTAAEMTGLMATARGLAAAERRRQGWPTPTIPVAAAPAPAVAGGGGLAALVGAIGAPAAPVAPLAPGAPPAGLPPAGALPPPVAPGAILPAPAGPPAAPGAPPAGGGLAGLAAAIGMGGAGPLGPGGAAGGGVVPAGGGALDVRVMTVNYEQSGERFRSFAVGVTLLEEARWPDSPVKGPPTVIWCCKFMLANGGTPTGWHQKWTTICKLQHTDAGVSTHEMCCRLLEIMLCFDQLQAGSLASAEFIVRQIQTQEQRWKERAMGNIGDAQQEANMYSGIQNRCNLCLCPALTEWVAEEARKESAVQKELRKAREERGLAAPKK